MEKKDPYAPPKDQKVSGKPSHWQQYLELLERKKVHQKARRWYVARVEAFLKELQPESVRQITATEVEAFFQKMARDTRLEDWQFSQAVDAIRILLVDLAQAPGVKGVDRDYWKQAARSLGQSHPTVVRDNDLKATQGSISPTF